MQASPDPQPREPDDAMMRAAHRRELNRRLRLAFLEGAEQHSRDTLGRGLTQDELHRVIGRFPAPIPGP